MMCSISNKVWINTKSVWELNKIIYIPIVRRLCTATTISSDLEDNKYLTKDKARTLVMNLTIEERDNLAWCLNHLESEEIKAEYRGLVPI